MSQSELIAHTQIAPLHVANEAFLVASTIERCPKTMMLRELVMNAVEAAGDAPEGRRHVEIREHPIDGVAKLCIWNTGPGMTATELHDICDLASSLHKQNALDRNFGMGAKVASLPSNRYGLRYRSCHEGVVSEVILGQRGGLYGRLLRESAAGLTAEVINATNDCRAEGGYDLETDWTEVVLFGNHADQDTLRDPYAGNPAMPANWVVADLVKRFFRLPAGTTLTLSPRAAGAAEPQRFRPLADRFGSFTQAETCPGVAGIKLHFGFTAPGQPGSIPGLGCIVHRNEIYGLREGDAWVLEAPSFGIPFGARHIAVIVELPDSYGVLPEGYRQFLRYAEGDQRQVLLSDFAGLVRTGLPAWLVRIIESFGPPKHDYHEEISGELSELLRQLDVRPAFRGVRKLRGAETPKPEKPKDEADEPPADRPKRPPPPPAFEKPPEIIGLSDPALIEERNLNGRAARYYPQSHQLFVNLTYPSIASMQAQLQTEFEGAPDPERSQRVARELAEWAITRKVSRALVHSLAKSSAGWTTQEIERAQATETLSLVADDYALLLEPARDRMAEMLGLRRPDRRGEAADWAARSARELAEAEGAAQRALAGAAASAVPYLCRVSEIHARRGNLPDAAAWAERAIAADPDSFAAHVSLSYTRLHQKAFDEAEEAARQALARAPEKHRAGIMRHLSVVLLGRRDHASALDWAQRAIAAQPQEPGAYLQLANVMLATGALDDAAAANESALDLQPDHTGALRQRSLIEEKRRNLDQAAVFARRAIDANPEESQNHVVLAKLLQEQGQLDAAKERMEAALLLHSGNPADLYQQLSRIESLRQDHEGALQLARRAVDVDPARAERHVHLADLLMTRGNLDEAENCLQTALSLSPASPAALHERLGRIAQRRGDAEAALTYLRQAIAAAPDEPWLQFQLSSRLLQAGQIDEAEAIARGIETTRSDVRVAVLRRLADIEERRRNLPAALQHARDAIAVDPRDSATLGLLARLLNAAGDREAAREQMQLALGLAPANPHLLVQLSHIEAGEDLDVAVKLARQAVALAPKEPGLHSHLSGLLLRRGDLDQAEEAAMAAVELSGGSAPFLRRTDEMTK